MITPTGPVSSSGRFPPEQQSAPYDTNLTVATSVSDIVDFYSYSPQTVQLSGALPKGVYYDSSIDPFNSNIHYVGLTGTPIEPNTSTFTVTSTNDIGSTALSTTFVTAPFTSTLSASNVSVYTGYNTNGTVTVWAVYSSRTITITGKGVKEFLLVAGGGGGGGDGNGAGGGGAGQYIYGKIVLTAGSYPVVIGAGGAGGVGPNSSGANGSNSSFAGITAYGGGYGGKFGTTGGLVTNGTNGGGAGGFGSSRTGAAADGGAGGFFNGGGGGSSRSDRDDYGTQPYSSPVGMRYSTVNDGSNGNASPSETGGNGGAPTSFSGIWPSTSPFPVGGGGGGGGGANGGTSYSGSASSSGGRGRGAAAGGYGGNGYYYGQGGGGGYYDGGDGQEGVLLLW